MGHNNARVRKVAITGISGYLEPIRKVGRDGIWWSPCRVLPGILPQRTPSSQSFSSAYRRSLRALWLKSSRYSFNNTRGGDYLASRPTKSASEAIFRIGSYQLLHENDAAQAVYLAIRKDLHGAYNVAGDAPLTLQELAELRNGRVIALPYFMVRALMGALWRMGRSPFAPEWTDLLRYPLIASNEKLNRAGWVPRYTTPEALQTLLVAREGD